MFTCSHKRVPYYLHVAYYVTVKVCTGFIDTAGYIVNHTVPLTHSHLDHSCGLNNPTIVRQGDGELLHTFICLHSTGLVENETSDCGTYYQ
uniref:Uncharacterized protein n=1 Tax=Anguilla anguilla TaxID=7936 RepID=A0A0E9SLN6_ANGAN